jgi:hypothetical protein
MEFLMTYGWAILAVLIAGGALAYFTGFYQRFIPAQCTMGVPFTCSESKVTSDGSLLLAVTNSGSSDLTVINATVFCNSDPNNPRSVTLNKFTASQNRVNGSFLRFNCGTLTGSQYKADIKMYYQYSGDQYNHMTTGYLRAYVEE